MTCWSCSGPTATWLGECSHGASYIAFGGFRRLNHEHRLERVHLVDRLYRLHLVDRVRGLDPVDRVGGLDRLGALRGLSAVPGLSGERRLDPVRAVPVFPAGLA